MINARLCRAARGLLGWTQDELANRANVGVNTIKKFESEKTNPRENNLISIEGKFRDHGIDFFLDKQGFWHVTYREYRLRGFSIDTGLNCELISQNGRVYWFRIPIETLALQSKQPIDGEEKALELFHTESSKFIDFMKNYIKKNGEGVAGGMYRVLNPQDII